VLGPSVADSEKLSDPDAGGTSAGGEIRFMQNKNLTVLLATEPPAITIGTLIYPALKLDRSFPFLIRLDSTT
jgi:hypothetical protein